MKTTKIDSEIDQEPESIEPEEVIKAPKKKKSLSNLRRQLNEEELKSSGVQVLLLDKIDELEEQVSEFSGFRDKFYKADKEKSVLEERMRHSIASEIMFGTALTLGALLIGLNPTYEETKFTNYLLVIGGILIIGAILSRVVRK